MRAEFIPPFIDATKAVIEMMAQTPVQAGNPEPRPDEEGTFGEVTGMIGMSGRNVHGNLMLSFDKGAILHIVSKMMMQEYTEISKDVVDAAGEITNMICGNVKRALEEHNCQFDMAIPTMLVGRGVVLGQLPNARAIRILFTTEKGPFVLEASLELS